MSHPNPSDLSTGPSREAGIPTEALDAVVLLVGCAAPIRQITRSLLSILQGSRQLSWQGLVLAAFHNWLTLFFLEREEKRERKKTQSLIAFAIRYTRVEKKISEVCHSKHHHSLHVPSYG